MGGGIYKLNLTLYSNKNSFRLKFLPSLQTNGSQSSLKTKLKFSNHKRDYKTNFSCDSYNAKLCKIKVA